MNAGDVKWAVTDADFQPSVPEAKQHGRWRLRLTMALAPEMDAKDVAAQLGAAKQFLRELSTRSGLVYITEAPPRGVHGGLEGAGLAECRRQIRSLRTSTVSMAHRLGALRAAAAALADKLRAMDGPMSAVCAMAQIHGAPYSGPTWTKEVSDVALRLDDGPLEGAMLSVEQAEALAAWASEPEREGGVSAWGPRFDGAMKVAREVRSAMVDLDRG